jgi:tripartite-type tricarboxylate transporter receptor subunit TctC
MPAIVARAACAALVLIAAPAAAFAQGTTGYPNRPIRMIVGFPPGGGADIIGRITAQRLTDLMGQQVVVDNRGGAGGVIATELAARAPADGYTLLVTSNPHAINPALYRKVGYDPIRDFAPVTQLVANPMVLAAHPSVPYRSVAELIAHARANPGKVSYGSGGQGASGHLAMELLRSMAKIELLHVPYKGTAPVLTELIAGQIQLTIGNAAPVVPQVKAGKLRGLAVTGSRRSAVVPDMPTVAESGLPGYDMTQWFCVLVPAGTPAPVIQRLSADLGKVLRTPEARDQFLAQGAEVAPGTPEALGALIRAEVARWAKVVGELGIKAN